MIDLEDMSSSSRVSFASVGVDIGDWKVACKDQSSLQGFAVGFRYLCSASISFLIVIFLVSAFALGFL